MVSLRIKTFTEIFKLPTKGFLAVLIVGSVLSLDGFLNRMFPAGIDEFDRQIIYSFSAGVFFLGLWQLSLFENSGFLRRTTADKIASLRLQCIILIILFIFNASCLISHINRVYLGEVTFTLTTWFLISIIMMVLIIGEVFFKWSTHPGLVIAISSCAYLFLIYHHIALIPLSQSTEVYSISSFEAIQRFVYGLDPYQVFDKSTSGPFTHLPGFWLTFFPSWLTGIDPRWTNRIALLAAVLLTYFGTEKRNRLTLGYILACFLMVPHHLFDNSTFMGLLCAFSALTYFCISKKFYLFAAAIVGLSMTVSLFFWLFVLFTVVYLIKKQPVCLWMLEVLVLITFAATLLLPFWWFYPDSFLYCTIEVWGDTVVRNGFNVAYWLDPLVGRYGMSFFQLVLFFIFFFSFLSREKTLTSYYIYTSFFTFFFLLLNHVVNNYVFSAVFLMMVFGVSVQISSTTESPEQDESDVVIPS